MVGANGNGDDPAELYRRYAPALHRRCASIVGSAEEARDLVQETFARFLAARVELRERASAFSVLYRIATNAAIDRLRRRGTAQEEPLEPAHAIVDRDSLPRRVENVHDLAQLTKGLDAEEVTVAVLYHVDGYPQEAIAAALELSRRTVGKILNRFEHHVRKRAARLGFVETPSGAAAASRGTRRAAGDV